MEQVKDTDKMPTAFVVWFLIWVCSTLGMWVYMIGEAFNYDWSFAWGMFWRLQFPFALLFTLDFFIVFMCGCRIIMWAVTPASRQPGEGE